MATGRVWGGFDHYQTRPAYILPRPAKELGYNAYTVESVEDLTKPFVSVYFSAAYMAWLSTYEGRWDFFTPS
ncbi:hypothetical protein LguiB_012465 [Lonicera macranthoides]